MTGIRTTIQAIAVSLALATGLLVPSGASFAASSAPTHGDEAASIAPFVLVDPIIVPVIDNERPLGFLIVEVIIDSPDAATATYIKRNMPRLRDGFIQTLNEYAWFEFKPGQIASPDRIERRMQAVADWILGDRETRILFKQVMLQNER